MVYSSHRHYMSMIPVCGVWRHIDNAYHATIVTYVCVFHRFPEWWFGACLRLRIGAVNDVCTRCKPSTVVVVSYGPGRDGRVEESAVHSDVGSRPGASHSYIYHGEVLERLHGERQPGTVYVLVLGHGFQRWGGYCFHIHTVFYYRNFNTRSISVFLHTPPSRFTGPYEAGVARYKHMYFNATENTFKIWALTVVCAIVFYECAKNIVRLCLDGQLRYDVVLLFVLSVFSHYYSWLVVTIYIWGRC